MKISQRFLRLFNGRGEQERRDFRQCLAVTNAHTEDIDRTISLRPGELAAMMEQEVEREVANDVQQTVQFPTFRMICRHRVPDVMVRLCRHAKHPAANTGMAICDEELCPVMRGAA